MKFKLPTSESILCSRCFSKKSKLDFDYSNFAFKIKDYVFPDRIEFPLIPTTSDSQYLCDKCASSYYPISCKAHGNILENYKFGKAPQCKECENDLSLILKGLLPKSFKGLNTLSKLTHSDKVLEANIWFAISNDEKLYIIEKNFVFSDSLENFSYQIDSNNNQSTFFAHHTINQKIFFKLTISSIEQIKTGKGFWLEPWLKHCTYNTYPKQPVYFSGLQYFTVSKHSLKPVLDINYLGLWTISENKFKFFGNDNINLPSLDYLSNWSSDSDYTKQLKFLFKKDNDDMAAHKSYILNMERNQLNIESLLLLQETERPLGMDSIFTIKLSDSKKRSSSETKMKDNIAGPFLFKINGSKTYNVLIEQGNSYIKLISLKNNTYCQFTYGYSYKDYLLLIEPDKNMVAVSSSSAAIFEVLPTSLKQPTAIFERNNDKFAFCFDKKTLGKFISLKFYDLGIVIDGRDNVAYKNVKDINFEKQADDKQASLQLNLGENIEYNLVGPYDYIHSIWKFLETQKTKKDAEALTTKDLYNKYNTLKRENLLIGLLSDIILFNKELDMDISLDELEGRLDALSDDDFHKDKMLYQQTVKKLIMFSTLLPKIKKDYVLTDTFYPYYQAKNEMNFVTEAFGGEVAQKIEQSEFDNILRASRQNIGFIQSKFNKIFQEIERALFPVENIFAKQEVQKHFMAKASKFAVYGGQAVLVGTLVVTAPAAAPVAAAGVAGAAAFGGVGILAGMMGIRAMGDILSSLHTNRESTILIKTASKKIFGWWNIFKTTLPTTIHEVSRMIDKENDRTVKRDNSIFLSLKKNDQISIEKLNETLKNKIKESTQLRFEEILSNSGVLFNEIAKEINEKAQKSIYYEMQTNTNQLKLPHLDNIGDRNND